MIKEGSNQIEMFDQYYQGAYAAQGGDKGAGSLELNKLVSFKKLTLMLIFTLVITVAAFSFGVEKGKKIILSNGYMMPANSQAASALQPALPRPIANQAIKTPQTKEANLPQQGTIKIKKNKNYRNFAYTIQVASISNANNTTTLLGNLRNKGYNPFSLAKGKYTVICIGEFNIRKEAQEYLDKIRSRYPDSMIRKL